MELKRRCGERVCWQSASLQPRNAIVVEAWKNDAGDRTLTDLMPFLEAIARQQPPDVRDVVASYRCVNDREDTALSQDAATDALAQKHVLKVV